jgi:putative phosphoribosyl transferase
MSIQFADRRDAGRCLAEALAHLSGQPGLLVLGLPRGGVPVAAEVAHALGAELDVLVVRKLGLPWQPELAMGAIASGGAQVLNTEVLQLAGVDDAAFKAVLARERAELARREQVFRGDRPPFDVRGRTVIVVDDGVATGATLRAGLAAIRQLSPRRLVAAVPVAPPDTLALLEREADEVVCLSSPADFYAVGAAYRRFDQTDDTEVRDLLSAHR